jgi:hypothetical protein
VTARGTTPFGFMAAARLRKTFRYPEDSDDDEHEREELDEEGPFVNHRNLKSIWSFTDNPAEQESVIERLRVQNDKRNAEYSVIVSPAELSQMRRPRGITKRRRYSSYRSPSLPSHSYRRQYSSHRCSPGVCTHRGGSLHLSPFFRW